MSATLYAGTLVDSEEGYQPADVAGFGWRNIQEVCPYHGSQFICSGSSVGGAGSDPGGWTRFSVEDPDAPLTLYQFDLGNVATGVSMLDLSIPLDQDTVLGQTTLSLNSTDNSSSGWFARDPLIPNPATVAFIGISLVGLGWSRPTKA